MNAYVLCRIRLASEIRMTDYYNLVNSMVASYCINRPHQEQKVYSLLRKIYHRTTEILFLFLMGVREMELQKKSVKIRTNPYGEFILGHPILK